MIDYKVLSMSATSARIQFLGEFNNNKTLWDVTIKRLSSEYNPDRSITYKQYITISQPLNNITPITIVLNVKKITTPVILKTIIMISKYKKLKLGRHEFSA